MNRPSEENEEIDECEVVAGRHAVFRLLPFDQPQGLEDDKQKLPNRAQLFFSETRLAEVEQPSVGVELW